MNEIQVKKLPKEEPCLHSKEHIKMDTNSGTDCSVTRKEHFSECGGVGGHFEKCTWMVKMCKQGLFFLQEI